MKKVPYPILIVRRGAYNLVDLERFVLSAFCLQSRHSPRLGYRPTLVNWLRRSDLNARSSAYEADEIPDFSTAQEHYSEPMILNGHTFRFFVFFECHLEQ